MHKIQEIDDRLIVVNSPIMPNVVMLKVAAPFKDNLMLSDILQARSLIVRSTLNLPISALQTKKYFENGPSLFEVIQLKKRLITPIYVTIALICAAVLQHSIQ